MTKSNGAHPYRELIWGMGRTGILGFGGGPSVIPLIRYEAVTRYRWMEDDEFGEVLALANALPGPIATKIAVYLGYRQKGVLGAITAALAHIMPSALAMITLLSAAQLMSASPIVQGMIAAVTPVIAVMLGVMAYEFAERAVKGLGKPLGFALFLVCFALLQIIDIHPAFVVIAFLGYGAFHFKTSAWFKKKKNRKEDYSTWSG
ncbi:MULTISPECIES: chromate transporter [unclassified Paenibacillus]|uniref:chromate transporter n=1 Tax=unclassified Paenibacillus TaxID=185978 RepID=UPI001B68C3B4|nr:MULTISPECIES: chromate transporter [unclassified Paenibacillus]MBP1154167.1 chromate transporter [Paenibacillus sp. PvP091]MBP1170448.1 chromate transporter [Paenibacillus sp. PvR098]MBP2441476.1 chromate transporter [Paenibacillus sp. PvP052]